MQMPKKTLFVTIKLCITFFVVVVAYSACIPKAKPIVYPYSANARYDFIATESGLVVENPTLAAAASTDEKEPLPASLALHSSISSSNSQYIFVAINRVANAIILTSPDAKSFLIRQEPFKAANNLGAIGTWPYKDGFLLQLYKDPFIEVTKQETDSSFLFFVHPSAYAESQSMQLPAQLADNKELYALFPSGQSWYGHLRTEVKGRIKQQYFKTDGFEPSSSSVAIDRKTFETALTPISVKSYKGPGAVAIQQIFSESPPLFIRLRSSIGEDRWLVTSKNLDDAATAFVWVLDENKVIVLEPNGKLTVAKEQTDPSSPPLFTSIQVQLSREEAEFSALTAIPSLAAISWEEGDFPYISKAGLIVLPLP